MTTATVNESEVNPTENVTEAQRRNDQLRELLPGLALEKRNGVPGAAGRLEKTEGEIAALDLRIRQDALADEGQVQHDEQAAEQAGNEELTKAEREAAAKHARWVKHAQAGDAAWQALYQWTVADKILGLDWEEAQRRVSQLKGEESTVRAPLIPQVQYLSAAVFHLAPDVSKGPTVFRDVGFEQGMTNAQALTAQRGGNQNDTPHQPKE